MIKDRSLSSKLFDLILFVMCTVVLVSIIAPDPEHLRRFLFQL